jgi:hypothetical protein
MINKIFLSFFLIGIFYLCFEYNHYAQINCLDIHHSISNDNLDYIIKKWTKKCNWNDSYSQCVKQTENDTKIIYQYKINNQVYCDKYLHNNIKISIFTLTILFITFYLF